MLGGSSFVHCQRQYLKVEYASAEASKQLIIDAKCGNIFFCCQKGLSYTVAERVIFVSIAC